jgi:hypothetical protein
MAKLPALRGLAFVVSGHNLVGTSDCKISEQNVWVQVTRAGQIIQPVTGYVTVKTERRCTTPLVARC